MRGTVASFSAGLSVTVVLISLLPAYSGSCLPALLSFCRFRRSQTSSAFRPSWGLAPLCIRPPLTHRGSRSPGHSQPAAQSPDTAAQAVLLSPAEPLHCSEDTGALSSNTPRNQCPPDTG